MRRHEVIHRLGKIRNLVNEAGDIWNEIPANATDNLERFFSNDQGIGYHLHWAENCLEDVSDNDIEI